MPSSNAAKLWWKRSSDRLTVASARAATVDRNASQSGVARTWWRWRAVGAGGLSVLAAGAESGECSLGRGAPSMLQTTINDNEQSKRDINEMRLLRASKLSDASQYC